MKLSHVFTAVLLSSTQLALAAPAEKATHGVAAARHLESREVLYKDNGHTHEEEIDEQTCEESKKHLVSIIPLWNTNTKDMIYVTLHAEQEYLERKGYEHYSRGPDFGWKMFNKEVRGSVPLYRLWNAARKDRMFATDSDVQKYKSLGYSVEVTAGYVYPKERCGAIPLHGFSKPGVYHEYTATQRERGILAAELHYQGIAGFVYPPTVITPSPDVDTHDTQHCESNKKYLIGVTPLWHAVHRDMVYVTDPGEIALFKQKGYGSYAASKGWKMFSKRVPGSVPLYRLYNSDPAVIDHMFALGQTKGAWTSRGYIEEGIAGYVYPDGRCTGTKRLEQLWMGYEFVTKAYSATSIYRKVGRSHQDHEYTVDGNEVKWLTDSWKYRRQVSVGYVYHPSTPSSETIY
ncbi:hypothetical protein HGRIS_000417 [Hohenbuehelia grisea]|uniref:DUF5648 domain-containing protein n=1 Tax=Hohenbuehelia grisea TaxID=104357 RepID=A0ABR3JQZ6_9AGAR